MGRYLGGPETGSGWNLIEKKTLPFSSKIRQGFFGQDVVNSKFNIYMKKLESIIKRS